MGYFLTRPRCNHKLHAELCAFLFFNQVSDFAFSSKENEHCWFQLSEIYFFFSCSAASVQFVLVRLTFFVGGLFIFEMRTYVKLSLYLSCLAFQLRYLRSLIGSFNSQYLHSLTSVLASEGFAFPTWDAPCEGPVSRKAVGEELGHLFSKVR